MLLNIVHLESSQGHIPELFEMARVLFPLKNHLETAFASPKMQIPAEVQDGTSIWVLAGET